MNTPNAVQALDDLTRGVVETSLKRPVDGPLRPSWGWRYEAVVRFLRRRFSAVHGSSIEALRASMDGLSELDVRPGKVDHAPVDADGVRCEWTQPRNEDRGHKVLYLHGGGYTVGSPRSHRGITARLARQTKGRVLSVDYRLAPEHPCPAALDDALTAYRWLASRVGASNIAVAGDSAGGGLALALLVALRDLGEPLPAGAFLMSPWVDLSMSMPSHQSNAAYDYLGTLGHQGEWGAAYAGELGVSDPRVSPLLADLSGLPPLLIHVGGAECLLDEAVALARKVTEAHGSATLEVLTDRVHVPHAFSFDPVGRSALRDGAEWIAERCGA